MQMNAFYRKVDELCVKNGITHRRLSELCGVNEVTMSRYLRGERKIQLSPFMLMCKALDVWPEELFKIYTYARLEKRVADKEKNRSDSLVTDSSDDCKESESKLDLISRQDVVNEIHKYFVEEIDKTPTEIDEDGDELYADMPTVNSLLACNKELSKRIKLLPSAEPQPKPISYIECANAMLKMWIDNVLTDGEYYRIMEKLNSKHMADMRGGDDNE